MGKHNKPRRCERGGQIVIAAAAATVLAGWAAPVAYADDGAATATNLEARQQGRADGAVQERRRRCAEGRARCRSSVQGAARDGLQVGSGGAGSLLTPNTNSPRSTVSARQTQAVTSTRSCRVCGGPTPRTQSVVR